MYMYVDCDLSLRTQTQSINQSINIRLLRHDKMQANNRKQKGNTVSKKKAGIENKSEN